MSNHFPLNSHTRGPKNGAGCMIMARPSGRFLMCKRAVGTPYPSVWASFGGKQEGDESPEQTARREAFEETGHRIDGEVYHLYRFSVPNFEFHTYLAVVESEFKPLLNQEADDAQWMTLESIPDNIHDGLRAILEDRLTVERLIKYVESISGRPCDFNRIYRPSTSTV